MKKIIALILACLLAFGAAGCGSAFSAEYYFSEPFREDGAISEGDETEVRNAATLKAAIMRLIANGEPRAQFRFSRYSGSLMDDLAAVCLEIKTATPMGAYAVEDISYDTSRIVSYYTADISIKYKKTSEELANVKSLSGLAELNAHILEEINAYSPETVVKIYSAGASEEYIRNFVSESYYADPMLVAAEPDVLVQAYPDSGAERIYVIDFRYPTMPEQLMEMERELAARIEEFAVGTVAEDNPVYVALRLASALAENCVSETILTLWLNTAYGAIVEGSNNSVAMAMAYKALCDRYGIGCMVVRGEHKDRGSSVHAWNIICIDGEYYHVDTSHFRENSASAFLLSDRDIWGDYDWDRSAYPPCDGHLGPESVFDKTLDLPEHADPEPSPSEPEETPEVEDSPSLPEDDTKEESKPEATKPLE